METSPLTCVLPNPSPKSSQKRTSSPGAPAAPTKKPKTGPGQGYSDKTKRRRKKKKLPITRESGVMSELVQDARLSSPSPGPPLPSASCSTENRPSFISSQSGSPLGGSSNTPSPVCAPPVAISSSSEAQLVANERVAEALQVESKSLRNHKALFASLVSSLVCQICLDLLHKPFALSPCGHVSCYGCLVNWFKVDQQIDGLEGGHMYRKKTCPQCRAIVRGRPIEAWNVKDMVAVVVKSGLAQDFPQPVEFNSPEAEFTNSGAPSRDPWANIFPPAPSRPGTPPIDGSPSAFGMYDAEDQVYRCLDCMHEIWGGLCSQCGRHYSGHNAYAHDDGASSEEHPGLWSILPVMEHIMGFPRSDNMDESDDGSFDASFIDDEDSRHHDSEVVGNSSDDNDDSIMEVSALATTLGRGGFSGGGQDGDDNISDTSDTESQTAPRRTTLRTRRQILSDSEVDDNSGYSAKSRDHESLSRPPIRLFGHLRGRHSAMHEDENADSQCAESGDSDNVGSDDRDLSVQLSGSESDEDAW